MADWFCIDDLLTVEELRPPEKAGPCVCVTCSSMSRRPCAGLGNKIKLTKLKLSNKIKLTTLIQHARIRGFFFENVSRKSKRLLKLQRRRTAIAIQKIASCLDTEYNFLLPSRSRRGRSPPCRTRTHTRHKSKMSHWRTSISGRTQLLTRGRLSEG